MSALNNLHNTDAGAGTSCEGPRSGRGRHEASQVVITRNPRNTKAKIKWTKALNKIVMKCYLKSDPSVRGYRRRMHDIWKEIGLFELSEQNLVGQARVIRTNEWLSSIEVEELKREIEREKMPHGTLENSIRIEQNQSVVQIENENSFPTEGISLNETINLMKGDGFSEEEIDIFKMIHEQLHNDDDGQPPNLRFVNRKLLKSKTASVNKVMPYFPMNSLTQVNALIKSSAMVVSKLLGVSKRKKEGSKEPWWKKRLAGKIKALHKERSQLQAMEKGTLKNELTRERLWKKYNIRKKGIKCVIEELNQRIIAKGAKIKRYSDRIDQYRQNRLFENNQKLLFEQLEGIERGNEETPQAQEAVDFWKGIWESDIRHRDDAEWIEEIDNDVSERLVHQEDLSVNREMLKKQANKLPNWKSPGPDGVQGFWIKNLTSVHSSLAAMLNDCLNIGHFPEWLTKGTTVLIMKDKEKGNIVTNYRPITCLPVMWKLFTSIFSESIYYHLEQNHLLPEEQKGCRKNSRGTKDQMLIDKMILRNCKRRTTNLVMGWIDYKKAFDMVPHSWLQKYLSMFGIAPNVQNVLKNSMNSWETNLTSGQVQLGKVKIKRGIFQGDSLSPMLFVISLIPMTLILRKVKAGYQLGKGLPIVNHLLFMDDLKVFGKNQKELDTLINTVRIFSDDIRMEFGISKCAVLVMKRGKMDHCSSHGLTLPSGEIIKSVDSEVGYKYLGFLEADRIKNNEMKEKVTIEYVRRLRKILKSHLHSRNIISAINSRAVSIIRYTAGVVEWNVDELKELDRRTRKLLTVYGAFARKGDVDRLYLPRKEGGRGLIGVEDVVRMEENSLKKYVSESNERLLQEVEREGICKEGKEKKLKCLEEKRERLRTKQLQCFS